MTRASIWRQFVTLQAMQVAFWTLMGVAIVTMPIAALLRREQFFFHRQLTKLNERYHVRYDAFESSVMR